MSILSFHKLCLTVRATQADASSVFSSSRVMVLRHDFQRDRQNMGSRYLEVFQGKRADYYAAIASVSVENRARWLLLFMLHLRVF